MSPQELLLVGMGVCLAYLCAAVYFTRATTDAGFGIVFEKEMSHGRIET